MAASKPKPKPVEEPKVKPKGGPKVRMTATELMQNIRDNHVDPDKGDLSYVYGDPLAENFTEPKLWFSTGLTLLDAILGNGGFGSGRVCEVYGPNRTAKSEFAQKCMEAFLEQYANGIAFYWDQEQAVDEKKKARVPLFRSKRVSWEWSPYAERLFGRIIAMVTDIADKAPDTPIFIVIDSLAGLETKEEMDKKLDEVASMAAIARLLSRMFRKLKPILQGTNTFLMILNQIRHKPNQPAFVDEESPGGEALKFWADYRIKTANAGQFYFKASTDDNPLPPDGLKVKYKTIKNKMAPPLRSITMPVLFAPKLGSQSGLSEVWSMFDHLNKVLKVIKAAGGRYSFEIDKPDDPKSKDKDKISFTREEWPMTLRDHRKALMPHIDRWTSSIMLEEGSDDIGDVEDVDDFSGGQKAAASSSGPRKSLLSLPEPPAPSGLGGTPTAPTTLEPAVA